MDAVICFPFCGFGQRPRRSQDEHQLRAKEGLKTKHAFHIAPETLSPRDSA